MMNKIENINRTNLKVNFPKMLKNVSIPIPRENMKFTK